MVFSFFISIDLNILYITTAIFRSRRKAESKRPSLLQRRLAVTSAGVRIDHDIAEHCVGIIGQPQRIEVMGSVHGLFLGADKRLFFGNGAQDVRNSSQVLFIRALVAVQALGVLVMSNPAYLPVFGAGLLQLGDATT